MESARSFFEQLRLGVVLLDARLDPVWSNRFFREHVARRLEMCEKHCFTGLAPGDTRCQDCLPPVVKRTQRTIDTMRSVRQADGRLQTYRVILTPVGEPGTGVLVLVLPLRTERADTTEGWRERFLLSAIRNSNDAIFALDRQQTVRFWNQGAERMFGLPVAAAVGRTLEHLFHPQALTEAEEVFHPADPASALPGRELRLLAGDRGEIWVEVSRTPLLDGSGNPNGASFVLRDVTERREALEKMAFTERMSAVGNMAAALAHEIGTPLGIISGNAEVLLLDLDRNDARREELEVILAETERIGGLVRELLEFARPESPEFEPLALSEPIERVARLVRHAARKQSTTLVIELPEGLPLVRGDANQLEQVVLNLTMNSLQALEQGGAVTLRVRTEERGEETGAPPGAKEDRLPGIVLEVTDTGPGIAPEVMGRIFHPFVTTKPEGTGLGLAVGKRIVEEHGGTISARNPEQGGAAFLVWLPRLDPEESS